MKGQPVAAGVREQGGGVRFFLILALLGVISSGGPLVAPATAAHYDNTVSDLASICYDCHTLNANLADDNTSFINASSPNMAQMRSRNGGITPAIFGCTYCHNNPIRTTNMKDAFSPFNARPSQHPLDRGYVRDGYANVTLGANTFTTLYLSNWDNSFVRPADQIDCVGCHDVSANGGSYPDHPVPGAGNRAAGVNPYMLRNTAAMDNGHAPASFCMQTCHAGTAPGTSGYRMGHYGWGAYDNAGTLATLKEHSGSPLKTSRCVDCHETHSSNKSNLFGEQKQSAQSIDPVNCAAVCHNDTLFRTGGHGRTGTGAPNLQCANCHNPGVPHRDPANPRRLSGTEASPPATPLLTNAAGNGLDDDFDGVIDNPGEANLQKGGESICGPCHANKFNHGGAISGNASASSGKVAGCLYCHEPHANGIGNNVRMVRRNLNGVPVNYLTDKVDYFRADNTGVCSNAACHGVPLATIMGNVPDHTTLPNGGVGADCSGCHAHSASAGSTTASFAPVCNSCHSYPGQTVIAGTHVLTPVHDLHALPDAGGGYGFGCQVCHLGNNHNQSGVVPGGAWTVQNGNVNIRFDNTWNPGSPTYAGANASTQAAPGVGGTGTCGGLYCHGRSASALPWSGATADPAWNNPSSAACGTCHRATVSAAPSSFAHAKHADNTTVGYNIGCQVCHYATTTTGTSIANRVEHVNRQSRVSFNTSDTFTGGGTYSGNPATVGTADPSMACTNIYCHSPGSRLTGPFDNGALGAPNWNQGPLACNACHGAPGQTGISVGMPAYPNGTPKANTHPKHLADKFACQVCHFNTTRDGVTIFTRSIHVDGVHNAQNDNLARHAFTYSTSTRTCSSAACHGGHNSGPGFPAWGQSTGIPFGCDVCHMNVNGSPAVADVDQFVYDNGMSKISADQWNGTTNGSGHGKTLPFASGNPGAGTRFATCTSNCHVTQVGHDNAVNPFRLRSYSGVADFSDANKDPGAQQDDNLVCLDCHSAAGANPTKATRLLEQNHYAGKHTASAAGGTFCVDCHDPHGDANHYMVQDNVSRTTDGVYGIPVATARAIFSRTNLDGATGFDTVYDWGDYVKSTDPKTGICQACHAGPPTGALYFYAAAGAAGFDGTHNKSGNPPQRCTVCHAHNADFTPSCNSCHGVGTSGTGAPPNAPYQNTANLWGAGIDRLGAPAGQGLHRAADNNLLTDHETLACQECHTNTPGSGGEHDNSANVNAVMTNLTARKWTDNVLLTTFLPRTAGRTSSVVDDSCNNVNCHSPYGAYQATAPSGTPFPYERYWENQNLWDCYTCHGYRDAADATNNPGALDRRVSTGSHDRHIRTLANGGMNYDCSMCHETGNAAKYSASSPPGTHKGGLVDWNFAGSPNPDNVLPASRTYSGTPLGGTASPTDNNTALGHRAYGTCANLYCHSIGQTATGGALTGTAGQYLSPAWGNPATGRCGACHGGDGVNDNASSVIASGSHGKHAGAAGALRYACSVCHNGLGRGAATHADNGIHLAFGTTLNGTTVNATYSQGNVHLAGNGFGSCTANYCHGTGTPALTGGANQLGTPNVPAWGTPGTSLCGSCHGAPGASTRYPGASNYPTSGAHARHVLDLSGPRMAVCSDCHAADTLSSHVDGKVDFRTAFDNTAATTLALTRTCDPCHGTGVAAAKANWSSVAALDCLTCHGATPAFSFANATGRIAPNVGGDNSTYGSAIKGHNRPTARGPYEISSNPAANQPCSACHDIATLHVDNVDGTSYAGNRLAATVNGTPVADNLVSTLCKACHATAGASPATKKGVNAHGNSGYPQRLEVGATFALECAQCHEPHGMVNVAAAPAGVNIWMINPTVTVRAAPLATVSPVRLFGKAGANSFNDFLPAGGTADNNNPAAYAGTDDLCVVCHANAANPGQPMAYNVAGIHNAPAYKGNEAGKDCSTCHGHNQDGNLATVDGLMPLQCNGCHSYPGLDNTALNLHFLSPSHREHVGASFPGGTANSREYDCTTCHLNYNHNQAQIKAPLGPTTWTDCVAPAFINVNFDTAINKRNANGPAYDCVLATGASTAPGVGGTGTCAGLYCHGNSGADTFAAGARDQSTWGGANPTPAWNGAVACGACHRADSTMPQGNHPAHLSAAYGPGVAAFSAAGRCAEGAGCHTSYGLSLTTTHTNGQPTFRTSVADNTGVGLALTGICANCHSASASSGGVGNDLVRSRTNWDNAAYRVPCVTCHNNGVQATANLDGTGNKATNIDLAWTLNGHGAAGVPPVGIDNASTTTDSGAVDQVPPVRCETCHDELAGHIGAAKTAINGTNPWRLDNGLTRYAQVGGIDNYCLGQCHSQTARPPRHARIVNGAFAQAKDNTLHTHPTATAVVGAGLAAWYQIPATDIPLEDDLATKTPARTGASLVACVSCHDPHGVGTALVPGRTFSGVNTLGAGTQNMLRYNSTSATSPTPLCAKCHK